MDADLAVAARGDNAAGWEEGDGGGRCPARQSLNDEESQGEGGEVGDAGKEDDRFDAADSDEGEEDEEGVGEEEEVDPDFKEVVDRPAAEEEYSECGDDETVDGDDARSMAGSMFTDGASVREEDSLSQASTNPKSSSFSARRRRGKAKGASGRLSVRDTGEIEPVDFYVDVDVRKTPELLEGRTGSKEQVRISLRESYWLGGVSACFGIVQGRGLPVQPVAMLAERAVPGSIPEGCILPHSRGKGRSARDRCCHQMLI